MLEALGVAGWRDTIKGPSATAEHAIPTTVISITSGSMAPIWARLLSTAPAPAGSSLATPTGTVTVTHSTI